MRILFAIALLTLCLSGLPAIIHAAPVKLAMVAESPETAEVVDLLTVEFSKNDQVQLLERAEIEKVYREQALSAGNRDYLKLGLLLGADGLLVMKAIADNPNLPPNATNAETLNVRLVAVKPGVVLFAQQYPGLLANSQRWLPSLANCLRPLFPKLTVTARAAIPISIVDLRSAVSTAEAAEMEQQLKLLAIQRLSREPRFFILERQRLGLVATEKDWQDDDSAFWTGSYLLEGVVDEKGYSPDTVTLNVRLAPPKGGPPISFTVSGVRTNLAEVISRLADETKAALQVQSTVPEWNAGDEASRFFAEAQWSLFWDNYPQARAAADSAWALGLKNEPCATLRIQICLMEIASAVGGYPPLHHQRVSSFYGNTMPMPEPARFATRITPHPVKPALPEVKNIDLAASALEIYLAFSHNHPDAISALPGKDQHRHNSDWYQVGLDDLIVASHVLQKFNAAAADDPMPDKLAELRGLARSAARLIATAPSVHDSYFVGSQPVAEDKLIADITEHTNIFQCEASWGRFWQEKPEDTLALYRELMSSPAFDYLHQDWQSAPGQTPPLIAWTASDRQRLPAIWEKFASELGRLTNETDNLAPAGTASQAAAKPMSRPAPVLPAHREPQETVTNVLTAGKFLAIPLAGLPDKNISGVTITAHHWIENQLVLDFKYTASRDTYDANTNWLETRTFTFPAIAILDPATEHWNVIEPPPPSEAAPNNFYHRTTLRRGELFTSAGEKIWEYDFQRRRWQPLPVSSGENLELFTVNDHLYAANRNQILEIMDDGQSTHVLGSLRLQAPASMFDRHDYGSPFLFPGPDHTLRLSAAGKFSVWTGAAWQEAGPAPLGLLSPEAAPDGMIFRHSTTSLLADNLSRLIPGTTVPQLCLGPKITNNTPLFNPVTALFHAEPAALGSAPPLWKLPRGYELAHLAAALRQTNLYLLAGHSEIETLTNRHQVLVKGRVLDRDGCNAILLCFTPGLPLPQKVFLKFDAPNGCPPLAGVDPSVPGTVLDLPPAWLLFANNCLWAGAEMPVGAMPHASGRGRGYRAGVWRLPASQLDSIIADQQQQQRTGAAQAARDSGQAQNNLLAKYDLNHNGVIDPGERVVALDDPAFIQWKLEEIDADHNGWLDLPELAWFDANTNAVLDAKKQAGIELALNALAAKLFSQYDQRDAGWLNQREYDQLIDATRGPHHHADTEFSFPSADKNHDNQVDQNELVDLMRKHLRSDLQKWARHHQPASRHQNPHWPADPFNGGRPAPSGMGSMNWPPADSQPEFKTHLEEYWQSVHASTNQVQTP